MVRLMPRPAVTIRLVPGTVTPGQWCGRCVTSAAATVQLAAIVPGGVADLGEMTWCDRCDDRRAVVREAVERVAADIGGTVLEGGGDGVDH